MADRDPFDKARLALAYTAIGVWVLAVVLDAVAQLFHWEYNIPSSIPTIAIGTAVFMFGAKSFVDVWRGNKRNGNGEAT